MKDLICNTAREAGALIMEGFSKMKCIEVKEGLGIVTDTDLKSEELIINKLSKGLPGSSILAEEKGEQKSASSEFKWIIDPLDGTSNYAHGFPWFCVSIALEKAGEVIAGAIYHPVLDEMFYAEKSEGATLNDNRIQVSNTTVIDKSLIATGFFYHTGQELTESVKRFEKVQQVALGVRRPGSAALDMAYTACGRFDAFWEKGLCPWDKAAGDIILREAGSKLSDFSGGLFSIYGNETLASNGNLHEAMIELLRT